MRVRELFSQLEPMKQMGSQLKKDRDSTMKKIAGIEKEMSSVMEKIQVMTYYVEL